MKIKTQLNVKENMSEKLAVMIKTVRNLRNEE